LVSKSFYDDVGLMDERYFLYFEEIDWAIRGLKFNYKLAYAKDVKVMHLEAASTSANFKKNTKTPISTYYGSRSRILFVKKFMPHLLFNVFFVNFFLGLRALIIADFRGFIYTAWGTVDGLKGHVGIKKEIHQIK
jgi:hypothetical protein